MTPEGAALMIQSAWRRFYERRDEAAHAACVEDMWDTYYHATRVDDDTCSDGDEVADTDDYDPPDEVVYYRY